MTLLKTLGINTAYALVFAIAKTLTLSVLTNMYSL